VVSNKGQQEEKPRLWLTIAQKCLLLFVAACMSVFGEIILCLVPRAPLVLASCEYFCRVGLLFSLLVIFLGVCKYRSALLATQVSKNNLTNSQAYDYNHLNSLRLFGYDKL
jgi:hypothetical protein